VSNVITLPVWVIVSPPAGVKVTKESSVPDVDVRLTFTLEPLVEEFKSYVSPLAVEAIVNPLPAPSSVRVILLPAVNVITSVLASDPVRVKVSFEPD